MRQLKTVSREELYALVWETPMYRLGEEFGITGNGLAKICDRLAVPYPPRGHWAKKAVGKAVTPPMLPPAPKGVPIRVEVHPTMPKAKPSEEAQSASQVAATKTAGLIIPEDLAEAHRIVRGWISEHKRRQKQRAEENRRQKNDEWGWGPSLIDDLMERDIYRFRISSAIFSAVEKAGGRIKDAPVTGKVTFLVDGQDVECSIIEKLCRPLMKPTGDAAKWTAFPNNRLNGLHYTGFLRVMITSYLGRSAPEWIETRKNKIDDWLPEIVGAIMSAGVTLTERERQRQEDHQRNMEEQARRGEIERQRVLDAERWKRFREAATDLEELRKLREFISALERRLRNEGDAVFGERSLSRWIEWAREKAATVDPLSRDLQSIFNPTS